MMTTLTCLNIRKRRKFEIIGASIIFVSYLCSCMKPQGKSSSSGVSRTEDISDSYTDIMTDETQTPTSESTESTSKVSSDTTTTTASEPKQKTNPLLELGIDYDTYCNYAHTILFDGNIYTNYGFDNSIILSRLRDIVYSHTGVYDDTLRLSDVNYFQDVGDLKDTYYGGKYADRLNHSFYTELVRAVLSIEGLRFGIDEIPASYFQQRFPAFIYSDFYFGNTFKILKDGSFNVDDGNRFLEMNDPINVDDDFWMDFFIYSACLTYNSCLDGYVYNSPYGIENNIRLELDSETGKNTLKPNEKQKQQLLEDIHSLKGCENINLDNPESRKEFIDAYGIDPIDLVGDSRAFSLNTKEGFEQYLQENGLEAPK
jgi:hypothetical protein